MTNETKGLEARVANIEERNKQVEMNKAWEISWTRRIAITVLSYIVTAAYLIAISNDKPLLNALVPAIGYLLSTLVLKTIRNMWQR